MLYQVMRNVSTILLLLSINLEWVWLLVEKDTEKVSWQIFDNKIILLSRETFLVLFPMVTECQELYVTNVKACKNKSDLLPLETEPITYDNNTILTSKHGQKTSVVPHSTEKHSQQIFSFSEHCSFHVLMYIYWNY